MNDISFSRLSWALYIWVCVPVQYNSVTPQNHLFLEEDTDTRTIPPR